MMKDLMPDANPPQSYRTSDNIEWTFLQTFPDYDEMQKFRQTNTFKPSPGDEKYRRIRYLCMRQRTHNCKFMLMALKTTKHRYHVYKHGKHNSHLFQKSKWNFIKTLKRFDIWKTYILNYTFCLSNITRLAL
jgi:hypothetical protein